LGYAVTPSTQLNPSTKNFTDVRNFEGELNNGAINLSLNGLQGSDYLLIGNPYPSAIDFNLFSAQNPNILASYWLWDASPIESNHSDYASWNSSGFNPVVNSQRASSDATIPAAQGFMVQVDPNFSGSSLTITFDNSQRMRSNLVTNGFYKSDPLRQVWLSLSSDSCSNSTLLCFDKNASSKFDRSFDAPAFKANTHHSFYSRLQHLDLAIQGLEPLSILKSRTIPLGMDIWRTGSYTISLDSSNLGNSDFKILLVDSLLQLKRDLEAGPYLFKLDQMGRQDNRFFLVFTKKIKPGSDPSSFEHCEGIGCYLSADRQLEVIAHDDLGPFKSIQIFNASGKLVQESNWSSNQNSVHIPLKVAEAGFYLIVAIDVNNRMYQSKILIP
jgi:frataxin-like iron-binding protein CyaY